MCMFKTYKYNYINQNINIVNICCPCSIQEIFRESLHSTELRLRVVKHKNNMDVQASHNTVTDKTQLPSSSFPKLSGLPFSNKENFTSGPSSNMDKCSHKFLLYSKLYLKVNFTKYV